MLNFRDEEWLPALEWLAGELNLNLDWQTLPEGKLSLFSTKDYAITEAEDLINMQLLARGYTLLKRGEILRLVPLKDIDITLVPRVTPEELEGLQKHQVVRVSIPLEWMVADQAATEFKPLLSPYGQMFPMTTSNRLEVLDAVVNLRELVRLLQRAESDDGRRVRVMEFVLKYRRAAEVAIQVRELLGLPADGRPSRSTQTQLDIEQAKFRAEAVKQLGTNARDLITEKKPDTFLVVNEKDNSIVVNAPPDKLEMVRQTIDTLDKPLPPSESSWQTVTRIKVHPVDGFDPETITKLLLTLQESGNLSKDARIQHEQAYNRIIAFASPEDQLTIANLIESYRAEKRSATVIPLTTISPEYAVKAVQLILKNPERPSTTPGVASDGQFQIEADPDNDRLLVWATPGELKEVREFLESLGETSSAAESQAQMHVVKIGAAEVEAVTGRLKRVWDDVSDAPLVIERKAEVKSGASGAGASSSSDRTPAADAKADEEARGNFKLVSSKGKSEQPAGKQQNSEQQTGEQKNAQQPATGPAEQTSDLPPVRIIQGQKGDVVIISKDPQAASTAKRLLEQLIPEPGDIHIIELKHSQAYQVRRQLEEMLEDTYRGSGSVSKLSSERRPISIDVDTRTNRLIVQHATAKQMELINEFVPLLDKPAEEDDRLARQRRVYRLKYRGAEEVSDIIKEVYRDLLSVNDRAFSNYNSYRTVGYNKNIAATASNPEYQGLLSIGADEEANLLVISAPGYLIDEIIELAESVDTPQDGPAMAVIPVAGDSSEDGQLREALSKILRNRGR